MLLTVFLLNNRATETLKGFNPQPPHRELKTEKGLALFFLIICYVLFILNIVLRARVLMQGACRLCPNTGGVYCLFYPC